MTIQQHSYSLERGLEVESATYIITTKNVYSCNNNKNNNNQISIAPYTVVTSEELAAGRISVRYKPD